MARRRAPSRAGGRAAVPRRYQRVDRLNEVLREVVADELERLGDDDDHRLRLVTVTGIACHPELIEATVFYSTMQDEAEVAVALEGQRHKLQRAVATQLRVRRTPVLSFTADPGVKAGRRLEEVLKEHPPIAGEVPVDPAAYLEGVIEVPGPEPAEGDGG